MSNKVKCGHEGCDARAEHIVSYEQPHHFEFRGQTHNCCWQHVNKEEFHVGDSVYCQNGRYESSGGKILKVVRVTKTLIITDDDRRFRIRDHRLSGANTSNPYAYTPEIVSAESPRTQKLLLMVSISRKLDTISLRLRPDKLIQNFSTIDHETFDQVASDFGELKELIDRHRELTS